MFVVKNRVSLLDVNVGVVKNQCINLRARRIGIVSEHKDLGLKAIFLWLVEIVPAN